MFNRFFKKPQYDFYLAGPMKGRIDGNKSVFDMVANGLRNQGKSVWSPAEQNDMDCTFHQCMVNDIDAVIHRCKAIALLPGWKNSLGANTEALCAHVCGKNIFYVHVAETHQTIEGYLFILIESRSSLVKDLTLPFDFSQTGFRQPEEMNVPEGKVLGK